MSATSREVAAKVRLSAAHSEYGQERPNDFGRNEVVTHKFAFVERTVSGPCPVVATAASEN
jgi:hypothetical protein